MMRMLIVDDPIENLSSIADYIGREDSEIVRTWDLDEAARIYDDQHFDIILVSALCTSLQGINICLNCKLKSPGNVSTIFYVPYPIEPESERFLNDIGIDYILKSTDNNEEIEEILKKISDNPPEDRPSPKRDFDPLELIGITNNIVDHAIRDFASRAKKLDEILENSTDVIYELDTHGKIVLISREIEKLTGYTREELIGMSAMEMTSPDSVEVVANHISKLITGQENPIAVEIGVQAKDGHVIPSEMIVRPIWNKNEVVGLLGIGRNVEERKRLERSLKYTMSEKEFYLDLMAHDIQNFNQAILSYLEMIIGTQDLDQAISRYAKGAFRQVTQIAQLIAHIKRVAQIRRAGSNGMKCMDLKEVLQNNITKLQSRTGDDVLIAITLNCPEGKYPIIAGDDINDILDLIVTSSLRYSTSDALHIKLTISSEFRNSNTFWIVEVTGKNLRLSESIVRCLLSPDYSDGQILERPDLQLLVVRAIVETIGGEIRAECAVDGTGDKFVFRLPKAQKET